MVSDDSCCSDYVSYVPYVSYALLSNIKRQRYSRVVPREIIQRDADFGVEIDRVIDLVFDARHEVHGLESSVLPHTFERQIDSAVDLEPPRHVAACQERQIDAGQVGSLVPGAAMDTA